MTGSFTSTICTFGLLCALLGYAFEVSAQNARVETERCAAEPVAPYFAPLNPSDEQTSEVCFIRVSEIGDAIGQYLRVDTASQPQSRISAPAGIHLPDWQIKTKSFLKNKPLLIVAEPHKRHSMAKLCRDLIQNGFLNPKILLNDIQIESGVASSLVVPVDDFVVEVSNFGAVTVAADQQVADELAFLGIPAIAAEEGADLTTAINAAAANFSLNGYLPVFIVGQPKAEQDLAQVVGENLVGPAFIVSGGIESIKKSLKVSALSAIKRHGTHGVSSCAG